MIIPRFLYGDLDLTAHPFAWEFGAELGAPEMVYEVIEGMLADGEPVSAERASNRELSFNVLIDDTDMAALADAEARLEMECRRPRNTLSVVPGDSFGPTSVFDTFRAQMRLERDDEHERNGFRRYVLTMPALPFARPADPILSPIMAAPPPPVDPTVVLVDACNSTSGWNATDYASLDILDIASTGGRVYNETFSPGVRLWRAGVVDLSSTPYLTVEWAVSKGGTIAWTPPAIVFTLAGAAISPVHTQIIEGGTWARSTYDLSDAGSSSSLLIFNLSPTVPAALQRLYIRNISRGDQIPMDGETGHQLSRVIPIEGSARTQASLHVWHDDDPLGDVLVHTGPTPNGMISLEPFLTSSATPAAGTVSGTSKSLSSPVTYDVPASLFDPDRATSYAAIARTNRAGTDALTATAQSMLGGFPVPGGVTHSTSASPPAQTAWTIVTLGPLTLPPTRVTGEAATVKVEVTLGSPTGSPVLDDVWLVDMEQGSLTWANVPTQSLFVDSPTVTSPIPRVRAASSEGEGEYELTPVSWGMHDFPPGDLYVYTVATGVASSKVQLNYFPRYHTHVAEIPGA